MCGGRMEDIPCSTFFHMFKPHKYSHQEKGQRFLEERIVETFFDEPFKKYHYRQKGYPEKLDFGDISKNKEKLKKANCKSFSWFIENVQHGMEIPNHIKDGIWNTTAGK